MPRRTIIVRLVYDLFPGWHNDHVVQALIDQGIMPAFHDSIVVDGLVYVIWKTSSPKNAATMFDLLKKASFRDVELSTYDVRPKLRLIKGGKNPRSLRNHA